MIEIVDGPCALVLKIAPSTVSFGPLRTQCCSKKFEDYRIQLMPTKPMKLKVFERIDEYPDTDSNLSAIPNSFVAQFLRAITAVDIKYFRRQL